MDSEQRPAKIWSILPYVFLVTGMIFALSVAKGDATAYIISLAFVLEFGYSKFMERFDELKEEIRKH